jgi:Animal haem peroxidase
MQFFQKRFKKSKLSQQQVCSGEIVNWGMISLISTLAVVCLPTIANAQSKCDYDPDCIGPNGYTPPTYTQSELFGFLSTVPAIASNPTLLYTGLWTNWYHEATLEGSLAKLAVQRLILNRNLYHPYLPNTLTGNIKDGDIVCDENTRKTRTINGTCNDLNDPAMGAVYTRFGRNVPLTVANPDTTNLLNPDPREISLRLLRRRGSGQTVPFLNLWAAAWTQFQIHDWFDHGPSDASRPISVPLAPDDPIRASTGQTMMTFGSTPVDSTRKEAEDGQLPPTYQNHVTHWWDASQIYGSDEQTARKLRTFQGGQLKLDSNGRLPIGSGGFGDTGFRSNWWLGLEMLHTLFAKEHNAIALRLAQAHPDMSDQQLYDKARMINAALIAKIHTLEWTPAILPNRSLDIAMHANWYGLNRYVSPPIPKPPNNTNPDPVIFGIVGGVRELKGVPFSITEEFAAVYRMHQLTPDKLRLVNLNGKPMRTIQTVNATNADARKIYDKYRPEELALSFGLQNPGALVLQNYPKFMTELEVPGGTKIDLATIDIVRDRERGVPRYNEFRRHLNLMPLTSINQINPDPQIQKHLNRVYGGDIEKVDLFVGTLAEAQRPEWFGFGETLFQTFILMASRRLQADRFYTNDYTPEVYTLEGLDWIENNTLKSVLLRHYPELQNTGLANVKNAFTPWNTTWSVDSDRHPSFQR